MPDTLSNTNTNIFMLVLKYLKNIKNILWLLHTEQGPNPKVQIYFTTSIREMYGYQQKSCVREILLFYQEPIVVMTFTK